MAGEGRDHWEFDPESGDYLLPSEEPYPYARCGVCGQELLTVEAVTLADRPVCGPCQDRERAAC